VRSQYTSRIGTNQVAGSKTLRQQKLGVLRNRSGGHRGLIAAVGVLMKQVTVENLSLILAAARACKTIRLAVALERFKAGLMGL